MTKTLAVLMLVAHIAGACPSGSIEWEGTCSKDIKPEIAPSVQPSDEKPPRSGLSAEHRGDAILMLPSLKDQDEKADQEKAEADQAGKKAAGIQ